MMSSYFDFYCKNIESEDAQNSDGITGTCFSMCPEEEVKLREVERLVHVLEVWGSERKLVKSYSRSAADSNMAVPHLLRPNSVLTNTVQYLLMDITRRVDVPASVVYDYVNDRLRAVRQDATIQRLPPEQCACLLEPMIRFYVYYGYKLSSLPIKDYDPVLNKKYLLECIKWYLSCCDTIDKTCGKIDHLTGFLSNLHLNGKDKKNKLANDKVLMESLYILCNLDDLHPLFRYVNLSKEFKRHPNLQLAYEIAIANLQGNYIKVCRLSEKLCPISYCALMNQLRAANWLVCNVTTPANYFHMIRRQIAMPFRKPLIIMTPKVGLKHPFYRSKFSEFLPGTHFRRVIPEEGPASKKPNEVKKLIFCSGNVAIKIEDIRKEAKAEAKLAVCRIEQLFPFPYDLILKEYCKYEKAKKCWCQEEHKNQGPWLFVKVRMENLFETKITCISRPSSPASATGIKWMHTKELKNLKAAILDGL